MGYSSDSEILNLFYNLEEISVANALKLETVSNYILTEDIVDADEGVVLARAFEPLTKQLFVHLKAGLKKFWRLIHQ